MSKMKKLKKNAVEAEPDTVTGEEKLLNENDTQEIQEYINQLGLDKFTPESLNQLVSKKEKKPKKTAKSKVSTDENEDAIPLLVPITKPTLKNTGVKKVANKKVTNDKTPSHTKEEVSINLNQTKQNKKLVFDDAGNPSKKEVSINFDQPKQNKKIVFDESYLVGSSKDPAAATASAKSNPLKNGKSQPINFDKAKDGTAWYNLKIKPDVPWYQQGKKLKTGSPITSTDERSKLEEEGRKLLEEDSFNFKKVREVGSEKSDNKWMQTVLKSGAFSDKIAAHTILLQESVPHNLQSLKFLVSLLNVKGRRECLESLNTLLRIFTEGNILNPAAKLVLFSKQPLSGLSKVTPRERQELLTLWTFEHQLKDLYNDFVQALDGLLKDAVETTRRKAISAISILLAYSPEQEQGLLTRLVNKIGDPTRGVATTSVSQLERLLQQHSNMKPVVVAEIERLLYRSNISTKAQYYALCFLSQILLDSEDVELATKLIIIYVSFFKACVKKGEVDSKLMSALLTGVKRAFPYTLSGATDGGPLEGHVDTLFKLVHIVRFGLAVQVLCILDQVVGTGQTNSDRFYSVLFRKLLDSDLWQSNKQTIFLNLLYRTLKRDDSVARLRAFVKRILQVSLSSPPQLACGLLYLTSELLKLRPELLIFPKEARQFIDDDDDDEEEHYDDVVEEDAENENASGEHQAETEKPEMEKSETEEPEIEKSETEELKSSTWVHRKNAQSKQNNRIGYDAMARNPIFARAEQSGGFWEMKQLKDHFHPSVALFAQTIMEGSVIEYSGDPLQDFTLTRFLDRFVFRNPKQVSTKQVSGPAQRRVLGKRNIYTPQGVRALAVDSKEFLKQPKSSIPVDELYLYQYFQRRSSKKGISKSADEDDNDSDLESVASEDFENYLAENTDLDFASVVKKPKTDKIKKKKDDEEEDDDNDSETDLDAAECDSDDDYDKDEDFQDAFKDFDDMLNDKSIPNLADGENREDIDDEDDTNDEDDDEDEDTDEDTDDDEFSDEENDESLGFREEDVDFSDEEEEEGKTKNKKTAVISKPAKKTKRPMEDDIDDLDWALGTKKKKRSRNMFADTGSDFVGAEEFSAMLEANSGKGMKFAGTSEALANKDKASAKQLAWEVSRNRWMTDKNRPRNGGRQKKKGGRKNNSGPAFRKNRAKRGGKN